MADHDVADRVAALAEALDLDPWQRDLIARAFTTDDTGELIHLALAPARREAPIPKADLRPYLDAIERDIAELARIT